jgi:hypothetical protein
MISGERFQNLAQICLYSSPNSNILKQNIKGNCVSIDSVTKEEIKKYRIIFVYTHDLTLFFDKFYNELNDVTLISHNSDDGVDESFLPLLDGTNIKKWYCQNRLVSHPKLFSLPIGVANSQWRHGNTNTLLYTRSNNAPKTNLVFKNFQINTNSVPRQLCDIITTGNGIKMSPVTGIEQYWNNLSSSYFAISPVGNGIDCHRIWECLTLRTIPVVIYHEAFSQFKHLPICFVDNWECVTEDFLKEQKEMYSNIDWNLIYSYMQISTWEKAINETSI